MTERSTYRCDRCGGTVPDDSAKRRLKQTKGKVLVCTDCKSDRRYMTMRLEKG